jgi:hypothetical protein
MSEEIGDESNDFTDLENPRIGFEISTLSSIERQIQLLPIWQPLSCVSGLSRCRGIVDLCCQFHTNVVQFTGTINSVFMSSFTIVYLRLVPDRTHLPL